MNPSEDLFLLVRSLTKSEKRYFKRFCSLYSTGKQNNYIKLFNAVDNQKVYDEKKIKDKFKNEKFIKQLNVLKDYLLKLILRSLKQFKSGRDTGIQLNDMIVEIEILAYKRIYKRSYSLLKYAKKIAEVREDNYELLKLLKIERKLFSSIGQSPRCFKIKKIADEEIRVMKNASLEIKYDIIHTRLYDVIYNTGIQSKGYIDNALKGKVNLIMKSRLLESKNIPKSIRNRYLYNISFLLYYKIMNKHEDVHIILRELIEIFEKNEEYKKKYFIDYCGTLYEFIWNCIQLKKYHIAFKSINKLYSLLNHEQIKLYESYYVKLSLAVFELSIKRNNFLGEIQETRSIINDVNIFLKIYIEVRDHTRLKHLYFYISVSYFLNKEYSSAILWLNRILKETNNEEDIDVNNLAKFFNVIIHFEMKNYLYIENLIKSYIYYAKNTGGIKSFEKVFLNTLYKISFATDQENKTSLFSELKNVILKDEIYCLKNDDIWAFDFISWIDSKLQSKTMLAIVREKAKNILKQNI